MILRIIGGLLLLQWLMPLYGQPNRVSVHWDNDFVLSTDQYYTNGLDIRWQSDKLYWKPISGLITPVPNPDWEQGFIGISQKLYTPEDLNLEDPQFDDRPFASYAGITLGNRRYFKSSDILLEGMWLMGVLGPASKGDGTQTFIHKVTPNNTPPIGWDNQVSNDLVFDWTLSASKNWLDTNETRELITTGTLQAGTLFSFAQVDARFRIGGLRTRISPFGPRRSDMQIPFGIAAFTEIRGKYMLHDATLVGGVLNSDGSIHTFGAADVERWVSEAEIGLVAFYKQWDLVFSVIRSTPTFDSGQSHGWGSLMLSYSF